MIHFAWKMLLKVRNGGEKPLMASALSPRGFHGNSESLTDTANEKRQRGDAEMLIENPVTSHAECSQQTLIHIIQREHNGLTITLV